MPKTGKKKPVTVMIRLDGDVHEAIELLRSEQTFEPTRTTVLTDLISKNPMLEPYLKRVQSLAA